jgi:hypothetical protein
MLDEGSGPHPAENDYNAVARLLDAHDLWALGYQGQGRAKQVTTADRDPIHLPNPLPLPLSLCGRHQGRGL